MNQLGSFDGLDGKGLIGEEYKASDRHNMLHLDRTFNQDSYRRGHTTLAKNSYKKGYSTTKNSPRAINEEK